MRERNKLSWQGYCWRLEEQATCCRGLAVSQLRGGQTTRARSTVAQDHEMTFFHFLYPETKFHWSEFNGFAGH